MSDSKKSRAIEKTIEIEAPVSAVWKALTDAEELTNWFPLEAKVTPGKDGRIWMSWRNEHQFEDNIEIWEPNKHLRLIPNTEGKDDLPDFITQIAMDFYLESKGNKTVLRLVQSGFSAEEDWDELYDATHRGWDFQLRALQHYLERHRGSKRGIVYVKQFIDNVPRDEAWNRLMRKQGLLTDGAQELKPEAPYRLQIPHGDELQGTIATFLPPKDFAGTVTNLNDGLLRIQLDELFGRRDVTITLATYGLPTENVNSLQQQFTEMLKQLFP